MITRRTLIQRTLSLGLATLVVASCTAQEAQSSAAPAVETIRVTIGDFGAESTAKWQGSLNMLPYISAMYDPLIAPDTEGALTKNGILTNWQFNTTGDKLTLTVRPGVKFHNGDEVTSADVKFTLETYARPGLPNVAGTVLRSSITSIDTPDKYTAVLNLASVNATLPFNLSWVEGDVGVIPKTYFESLPGATFEEKTAAFVKAPIATGPFKFVSREVGKSIEFAANPDYFDKANAPKFKKLILLKTTELATRMSMMQAGEAEVSEVSADAAIQGQKAGLKPFLIQNIAHAGLVFMQSYDPSFSTNDVRVRKALVLAVDRAALVKALFPEIPGAGTTGTLSRGPLLVGPGVAGYTADLPSYGYDPQMARQLLTDAGYLRNPKLVIAWSFPQSSLAVSQKLLEGIVEYWKAVGVNVEIRATEGGAIIAKVSENPQRFTANDVMMVNASYRPSGVNNLKVFATSKKLGLQADNANLEKMDAAVLNAQAIFDQEKYNAAMSTLWKSIVDDYWALPIAWVQNIYLLNPKVVASWRPINHAGGFPAWHTLVPVGAK